jgi:hypothetical protein
MVEVERGPASADCKFKNVVTCQCTHAYTSSFVLERELNSRLNLNDLHSSVLCHYYGPAFCHHVTVFAQIQDDSNLR